MRVLKARLARGTGLDTSYLFCGGHGQGKTTLARILARALLCENLVDGEPCNECDNCRGILNENSSAFVEQDAASRGTIANIRGIVDDLPFVVPGAPKRIYLFDEAHRMTKEAQDVLLKPLEEKALVGMFCTTEPEKIRGPIRSRCEEYLIRKVSREDILARMKRVLDQEQVTYEEDAILVIVDYSGGHVRDILNRLEMVAQMGPVTVETVREHLHLSVVSIYYQILLSLGDPAKSVALTEQACDRVGADEVATGLAEAAMNSFRLAHGLFADFSIADRQLSDQVYKMYGEQITQIAGYFLQSYKPSKVGLICDVVRCAKGIPALGSSAAPVVVSVAAPAAPAPAAPPQPAATVEAAAEDLLAPTDSSPTVAPTSPAELSVPAAAPVPSASLKPQGSDKIRADGKGSLGTGDPQALTDLDHKAIKLHPPRGALRQVAEPTSRITEGGKPVDVLPTPQWRQEFIEAWSTNGRGA